MKRTRLVSIDNDAVQPEDTASAADLDLAEDQIVEESEAVDEASVDVLEESEEYYVEEEAAPASMGRGWMLPTIALLTMAGWTAFFVWAQGGALTSVTPQDGVALAGAWSLPILVIAMVWLLALRTSRREARRFGDAALSLRQESAALETRLAQVNGELSVAREFLAAQSRDLETLGRMATERLGEHSERLRTLIADNGIEVEKLSDVSDRALHNMEKLRGDLPVIASSTKDVTNTIAQAGRTAHEQLDEMVAGLERVNEFGTASEQQVVALRDQVRAITDDFATTIETTGAALAERYNNLSEQVGKARVDFEKDEVNALAAMHERWNALGGELRDAMAGLETLDKDVLLAARDNIEGLRADHEELVEQAGVANDRFDTDLARRRAAIDDDRDSAIEGLRTRLADLDNELEARRAGHEERAQSVVGLAETLTDRMDALASVAFKASERGQEAGETIDGALANTTERLAATDESLRNTDTLMSELTETSVRLLELVRATAEHGSSHLPEALRMGEATLTELEERANTLGATVSDTAQRGTVLLDDMRAAEERLAALLADFDAVEGKSTAQGETLARLSDDLDGVRERSEGLAEQASGELARAIEALTAANAAAIEQLGEDNAGGLDAWAKRVAHVGGEALDKAVRERIDATAGVIDDATERSVEKSREATVALRDQLAKVDELTGNLERRVAQARERAEERVDNDFSRRAALITESLNSSSIDIAKALSADVADTAWASYLRGDRGIFTRRAVRLLESSESREIAELYEADDGFREDVSRYIHDFEAMLRQLLSTRDGHSLSVTLLSSDMGKLYVALAQGIERLRS